MKSSTPSGQTVKAIIVANLKGIWVVTSSGCRIDCCGGNVLDIANRCKAQGYRLIAIRRAFPCPGTF